MMRSLFDRYIDRRSFIAAAGLSAATASCAFLIPNKAKAADMKDGNDFYDPWLDAVAKAKDEGVPVFYGLSCKEDVTTRATSYVSGYATTGLTILIYPDTLSAIATYDVSDESRIIRFRTTWLSLNMGSIVNSTYNYTIIDSGRTLAIQYVASFKEFLTGNTRSGNAYAEFYPSGSGKLRMTAW